MKNPFKGAWSWFTNLFGGSTEIENPETVEDSIPREVLNVNPALTEAQWRTVVGLVKDAEGTFPAQGSGASKKAFVMRTLGRVWEGVEPVVIALLIDVTVKWLKGAAKL